MLTNASIKQNLDYLADKIEPTDGSAAANLRSLGEAVDGGPRADDWAFSDIYAIIAPEQIAEKFSNRFASDRWVRWLEFLRNSLVLLPLAITWFGIFLAVSAYGTLLSTASPGERDVLQAQSFIYLWQSGFEGHTRASLGALALIDGILLAMVFFFTLLVYGRSAWVGNRREQTADQMETELRQALGEADLALSARRAPQPYTAFAKLTDQAQKFLDGLVEEQSRLTELARQRDRELDSLSASATELSRGTQMMLDTSQTIREAQAGMVEGNKQIGALVALEKDVLSVLNAHAAEQEKSNVALAEGLGGLDLALRQTAEVVASISGTANGMVLMADALGKNVQAMVKTNQSYQATQADMTESISALGASVQALSGQQQELLPLTQYTAQTLGTLLTEQKQTVAQLTNLAAEQQSAATQLFDGIAVLNTALPQMTSMAENVVNVAGSFVSEQTDFLKSLQDEREAQTDLAKLVSASTTGIESALRLFDKYAAMLHGIAVDMADLARTLPSVAASMRADLSVLINRSEQATSAIEQASRDLEAASLSQEQSSRGFGRP